MINEIIIATRKSKLAMWQAQYIQKKLLDFYPKFNINLLGLSTKRDESQASNIALSTIGGKSLFTKELEEALYTKKAHVAIHSLKDVPMSLPILEQPFILGAVLVREDV